MGGVDEQWLIGSPVKIPIESLVTGYGQVVDESRVEYYVKH